jgi:hypothetical protein
MRMILSAGDVMILDGGIMASGIHRRHSTRYEGGGLLAIYGSLR